VLTDRVMMVKPYKFQALITLDADGSSPVNLDGTMHRVVIRGQNHQTHDSQVFSALVSSFDAGAFRLDGDHALVTVRLVGEEPREYFDVGAHFSLWFGHDVGNGVVTRRLFI
jgi:hypothetical protein